MGQGRHLFALAACVALAACDASSAQTNGADLDIGQYRRTFLEDFHDFDVTAWGPGSRWIAHTPWNGDFGDATFSDPTPGFPFKTAGHMLRIEASKDLGGHWRSGLISSRDKQGPAGQGFAQQYGYFEIEMKLPAGPGTWPGFWLADVNHSPAAEIDVMEYYGQAPNEYHANVHVWVDDKQTFADGHIVSIPPGSASDRFNRYGVSIDHDWTRFYFNRKEVWATPTRPEYRHPLYILVDLALGSGWPTDKTPNPSFMYVKSIAASEKTS